MNAKLTDGITWPRGFRAAAGTCGIKASGKPDLALIVADVPCAAAGVFTTNLMPSAPVIVGRRHLRSGWGQAIIVNSGNANASTGAAGVRDAVEMCRLVARATGVETTQVLPSSTGIIGRPLPMEKITRGVTDLAGRLDRGPQADEAAARGIMTTDLVPKSAARSLRLGGRTVRLAGICKGSGMIAPNMGTMLAYVTTDAAIAPGALKKALQAAAATSFNRISVDQHTSPSDTLVALASGLAGNAVLAQTGPTARDLAAFAAALEDLCQDLAYQIVKDGEGATKVFRVRVTGARSQRDADRAAKAVVDSPLVKCAVHGGDPNWGRVTTAAGYSGAAVKPEKMSLRIADPVRPRQAVEVFRGGQPTALTKANAARLGAIMKLREILFVLDLGLGQAETEWLGCDLSRDYIAINADYTT